MLNNGRIVYFFLHKRANHCKIVEGYVRNISKWEGMYV